MDVSAEHINLFIGKCKNANWAGVFYSPPFESNFKFLLQDLNYPSNTLGEQFIFHPFDHQTVPEIVLQPQFNHDEALQYLYTEVGASGFWESPFLSKINSTSIEQYSRHFKKYQEAIQVGNCSKAILSTVVKKDLPGDLNWGAFLLKLRQAYPQAFIYLLSTPIGGTWIGATPETLLKWDSGIVSTMSLAGTRKKMDTVFSFGNKEKEEQKIVTDYIQKIFQDAVGVAKVDEPVEFLYGEMVHLITKISAHPPTGFSMDNFFTLVTELHPTPAVGGYPKKEAFRLIQSTEDHSRLYYSGYLGVMANHTAELAVNLRCMSITKTHAYIFAGGGITADSRLEAEWAETRLKAEALLKFL